MVKSQHSLQQLVLNSVALIFLLAIGFSGCTLAGNLGQPSPTPANPLTATDTILHLPDLVIVDVVVEHDSKEECPTLDSPLHTLVQIENRGTADAQAFMVEVNQHSQSVSNGLVAGQTVILWFANYKQQTDILLDATYQVPESNEKNNRAYRELTAPTPAPACLPTPTPEIAYLQPLAALEGHNAAVWSLAFSPDGNLLASGSVDNTLRLWRVRERDLLRTMRGHPFPIRVVRFAPNGSWLATGSTDGVIRIWRVSDGKLLQSLQGHAGWVTGLDFSPDNKYLLSGAQDFTVRLWRVSDGKLLQTVDEGMASINSLTFSPDGLTLAWVESDGTVRLRSLGGTWIYILKEASTEASSIAFSPDGSQLVAGFGDGSIRTWRMSDGALLQTFKGHDQAITSLQFSPDGAWLVTGSLDQTLRLWFFSGENFQTVPVFILAGHSSPVNSVAFSPKGTIIASASEDGVILLWTFPEE